MRKIFNIFQEVYFKGNIYIVINKLLPKPLYTLNIDFLVMLKIVKNIPSKAYFR